MSRRRPRSRAPFSLLASVALGACGQAPPDDAQLPDGPPVTIQIAPLSLPDIEDAVWDIDVANGVGVPVWQARVTSSQYGDGAGAVTYVGPCDADPTDDASENVVGLTFVGAYTSPVSLSGAASDYAGPAPTGAEPIVAPGRMTQTVTCVEDADVAVDFDVTVMRRAGQGFFDVAVEFNEVFCSAKFDCERPSGADHDFLHDPATGERDRTFVLALACGAGQPEEVETVMYLDDLVIDCGGGGTITIDPLAAEGNFLRGGAWEGVTTTGDPPSLFQVASYQGTEELDALLKAYVDVAIGVGDADLSGCTLRTSGTADDGGDVLAEQTIPAGTVYPFVHWDVDLGTCTRHAMNAPDGVVAVRYTANDGPGTDDTPYGDFTLPRMFDPFSGFCDDCTTESGEPNIGGGCTDDDACWTGLCEAGVCVNPVTMSCLFDPPNIPADGQTEATLTCQVTEGDASQVEAVTIDLSSIGGAAETPVPQDGSDAWRLDGITVPVDTEPGQYAADIEADGADNRAWVPFQVVVPEEFDPDTYIYIYFDSSGSMSSTETPLEQMRDGVLRDALLTYYDGDTQLYDERVSITSIGGEHTFEWMHAPRPSASDSRVVVFVFQDEASGNYHSDGIPSSPTANYRNDFGMFRDALLETDPAQQRWSLYRGGIAAVEGAGVQTAFNHLIEYIMTGDGDSGWIPSWDEGWLLTPWNPMLNGNQPPATGVDALITYRNWIEDGVSYSSDPTYYFDVLQAMAEDLQIFIPDP